MKIAHVFASIEQGAPPSLLSEHLSAVASWTDAREKSRSTHSIQIVGVCFDSSSNRSEQFPAVSFVDSYGSTARDILGEKSPPFPLLREILACVPEDADWVIFSNSDIHLIESGYDDIFGLLDGESAISINRVTLPEEAIGQSGKSLRKLLEEAVPHPGSDLFVFRRSKIEELVTDNVFQGQPPIGRLMLMNLRLACGDLKIVHNSGISYHFGDPRSWERKTKAARANMIFAVRAVAGLREKYGPQSLRQLESEGFRSGGIRILIWASFFVRSRSKWWVLALALSPTRGAIFFSRSLRKVTRLLTRLLRKVTKPLTRRWRRKYNFSGRNGRDLEVAVISPGGVASTTLMSHLQGYLEVNSVQDQDGLKHLPVLPRWLEQSDIPILYIQAVDKAEAIQSLKRRGFHRNHLVLLASSPSDFLAAFAPTKIVESRLSQLIEAQAHYFHRLARSERALVIRRDDLFESQHAISQFLSLDATSFIRLFPPDKNEN